MRFRFLAVVALTAALTLVLPAATYASTYVVDRSDDPAGAGACTVAANDCSLNQALALAGTTLAPDVVQLPAGTYDNGSGSATATPVTIIGAGARSTIIRPSVDAIVFATSDAGNVTVQGVTMTGGRAGGPAFGAGIFASGTTTLTLRGVALIDNQASGDPQNDTQHYVGAGGGLRMNGGSVTIDDSVIANNRAVAGQTGVGGWGGGIFLSTGHNVIRNSTISGNLAIGSSTASALGGGIYVQDGVSLELDNVTLARNSATDEGGDLWRGPTSVVSVLGTIFSQGAAALGANCNAPATLSSGGNIDSGTTCGLVAPDRSSVDPLLGPLSNNGGPTDTLALGAGSPAIDFGGACGLVADQRGIARPFGAACDSGAFENNTPPPSPAPAPTVVATPATPRCSLSPSGNTSGLKVIATCDLAAAATLRGVVTIRPAAKAKRKAKRSAAKLRTVKLGPVAKSLTAGRLVTISVRVPKTVVQAVRGKRRVSLKFTLTAVTAAGGRSSTSASIAKLTVAPAKRSARR